MTQDIGYLYRNLCETPSDINEHLPSFVDLVEGLVNVNGIHGVRIIELGVRHGVSTIAWLYGLSKRGGRGHLWSVDLNFPFGDTPVRKLAAVDKERWTFVLAKDESSYALDAVPEKCDIVFIDTAHSLAQTKLELELYGTRVRRGGKIVLHDTLENVVETGYPVRTAIEEFVTKRRLTWTDHKFNNGIGVIEM